MALALQRSWYIDRMIDRLIERWTDRLANNGMGLIENVYRQNDRQRQRGGQRDTEVFIERQKKKERR